MALFVWPLCYRSCVFSTVFGPIYYTVVFHLSAALGLVVRFNSVPPL